MYFDCLGEVVGACLGRVKVTVDELPIQGKPPHWEGGGVVAGISD